MLQTQGVILHQGREALLIRLDHAAPATRVATDTGQRDRSVAGQHPRINQGPQQGNGARGVAAWVAHPGRLGDPVLLLRAKLGQSIDPRRLGAMRTGCVDDFGRLGAQTLDQSDRFARLFIGQTQHHQVGFTHQNPLGAHVFAQIGLNGQHRQGRLTLELLLDQEACGAGFAIDEYFEHFYVPVKRISPR